MRLQAGINLKTTTYTQHNERTRKVLIKALEEMESVLRKACADADIVLSTDAISTHYSEVNGEK